MAWVLDPKEPMAGLVADGGTIVARVSPGCWGAMITPDYASGHEVTHPIAVEGAEIGEDAIKCTACKTSVKPFHLDNGYTMLFNAERTIGVTVPTQMSEEIASQSQQFSAIPPGSCQYSSNLLAKGDLWGVLARVRPMVGNIGSCPSVAMPSSHNAGDFGSFLINASHQYALTPEQLLQRTDGHMDINEVGEGAMVIVPVKVAQAGIYVGDVHAMMGDGEVAGHTTDVSAEVKNRATITGDIQIGRLPGVVQVTMLTPASVLARLNLLNLYQMQYH
jgi:acetamidase/formamidase